MKFLELTRLLAFTTAEEETSTSLLNKLKTQLVVEWWDKFKSWKLAFRSAFWLGFLYQFQVLDELVDEHLVPYPELEQFAVLVVEVDGEVEVLVFLYLLLLFVFLDAWPDFSLLKTDDLWKRYRLSLLGSFIWPTKLSLLLVQEYFLFVRVDGILCILYHKNSLLQGFESLQ